MDVVDVVTSEGGSLKAEAGAGASRMRVRQWADPCGSESECDLQAALSKGRDGVRLWAVHAVPNQQTKNLGRTFATGACYVRTEFLCDPHICRRISAASRLPEQKGRAIVAKTAEKIVVETRPDTAVFCLRRIWRTNVATPLSRYLVRCLTCGERVTSRVVGNGPRPCWYSRTCVNVVCVRLRVQENDEQKGPSAGRPTPGVRTDVKKARNRAQERGQYRECIPIGTGPGCFEKGRMAVSYGPDWTEEIPDG